MNKRVAKFILGYHFILILTVFITGAVISHYFNTWTVSYLFNNFYWSEIVNAAIGFAVQIITIIGFPYLYLKFAYFRADNKINSNVE